MPRGAVMVTVEMLDAAILDAAAGVIAAEHRTARALNPSIPADGGDPECCHHALARLVADGHHGFVARRDGRYVGVRCGRVIGPHVAVLRAHGLAIDPAVDDPTSVLARLYAELAPQLIDEGAVYHHATHVDMPSLAEAFYNLGFGRAAVYAVQCARPRERDPDAEIRIAGSEDLDVIAGLAHIEMEHRYTAPIYAPERRLSLHQVRERHERLMEQGAVHFVARAPAGDVGLLTLEVSYSAPRLCRDGEPFIGATATHPEARGRGIAGALVEAALDWAHQHGFGFVSVDFMPANPLSRPFWRGAGFRPTGYAVVRRIHN